jgi:hypothetical protein
MISIADIKEDKEINEIVYNYFSNYYKNQQQAFEEFKKLNTKMKLNPNTKLVKFGNIVFLLKLDDDEIEFHSIGKETSTFAYIKDLHELCDYEKKLNVKAVYSYSNDSVFEIIFRRIKLNFTQDLKVAPDGHTYNYYRLEF